VILPLQNILFRNTIIVLRDGANEGSVPTKKRFSEQLGAVVYVGKGRSLSGIGPTKNI
jgi:hypothetical protein